MGKNTEARDVLNEVHKTLIGIIEKRAAIAEDYRAGKLTADEAGLQFRNVWVEILRARALVDQIQAKLMDVP